MIDISPGSACRCGCICKLFEFLEGDFADHMFNAAGIFLGGLRIDAYADKVLGDNFMTFIDPFGNSKTLIG